MALALINIGPQNSGTGDSLFAAFTKINAAISQINSGGAPGIFTGTAGVYAVTANGSPTSGQSFGELISAGTTNADVALLVQNQAATSQFLKIFGDGHGFFGPSSSLGLSWSTTGVYTLAAPSSAGVALTVNSTVNAQIAAFGPTTNGYIQVSDNSGNVAQLGAGGGEGWVGTSSAVAFAIRTAATDAIKINTSGAVTIPAPSSGTSLAINGAVGSAAVTIAASSANAALTLAGGSGQYAEIITASGVSSNSLGLRIIAGTNASDIAFRVDNDAATITYLEVRGDGQVQALGGPSSGYALTVANPSSTAGTSFGVQIQAGTNTSDVTLNILNQAGTVVFRIFGDGGVTVGAAPTGGSKGAGTINVSSGVYLNGTLYTSP